MLPVRPWPLLVAGALVAGAGWTLAARAPGPAQWPAAPAAWGPLATPRLDKLPAPYADLSPVAAATPELAVRGYLDTIARAALVPRWHPARGGSIGAETEPYPRAYAFLHPDRQAALPYADWLQQWQNVAHVGTIQVEAAGANRFFVEVERVEVDAGHGALAYHSGFFTVAPTAAGWRLTSAELTPEDLITVPLGTHQPWRTDLALFTAHLLQRPGPPAAIRTRGRVVELDYPATGGQPGLRLRLTRQVDGDWVLLERSPRP